MLVFLDDHLFELADEASNTRKQHLYVNAMHEIRVNRESVEKRFFEAFINAFAAMSSNDHVASIFS
ncbi:MAG: hypothetical protein ACI9SK_002618 [Zhongshania sp.]